MLSFTDLQGVKDYFIGASLINGQWSWMSNGLPLAPFMWKTNPKTGGKLCILNWSTSFAGISNSVTKLTTMGVICEWPY